MSSRIISYGGFTPFHLDESIDVQISSQKSVIKGTSLVDHIISGPGGSTVYASGGDDIIQGGAHAPGSSASFLYGDAGNDTITMAGADWAFGGNGDDTLISSLDGGHLSGDAGDDMISGGRGSDSILGGDGDDLIYGSAGSDMIDGGSGSDVLTFIHADDGLHIGTGFVSSDKTTRYTTSPQTQYQNVEQIRGSLHDDLIDVASGGPKDLRGMGGNDTFNLYYPSESGLTLLYGGDGIDTLDMSTSMGAYSNPVGGRVYVNFTPPTMVDGQPTSGLVTTDIEHIVGSMGGDIFMLKEMPTEITIDGNGAPYWGLDVVDFSLAEAGITGSFSNITNIAIIRGSGHDDTIDTNVNVQTVYGGDGRDVFIARGHYTRFYGGKDENSAENFVDTADLTGLTSRATITSQNGGWYYPTTIGVVSVSGRDDFLGIERIVGGNNGIDVALPKGLFIGQVLGGTGNDTFVAMEGITFDGGAGYDVVNFGASSTGMEFDGRQIISGGTELGTVSGYEEIVGSTLSDIFRGGDGMVFRSGGGADVFHSGRGGSTFHGAYQDYAGYLSTMVLDETGTIRIGIPTASDPYPGVKDDLGNTAYGIGKVTGSTGNDTFILGSQGRGELPYRIEGGGGHDTLELVGNINFNANYASFFTPGSVYTSAIVTGFDTFRLDSGTLTGTMFADTIYAHGTSNVDGYNGDDVIEAYEQATASGGEGDDVIRSFGANNVYGGNGNDTLYAGSTSLYLDGGQGDDVIYANGSNVGNVHVSDQYGTNRIFAKAGVEVDFSVYTYDRFMGAHDVGGGLFQIDIMKDGHAASTVVSGVDHVNIYTNNGLNVIGLSPGLDIFGF